MLHSVSANRGQESPSHLPEAQAPWVSASLLGPAPPAQPHWPRQPDGSWPGSRSPRGRPVGHGWTTGKPQAPTHPARHIRHSAPAIPGDKDWATISALPQVVGPSTSPSTLREAGTRRRHRRALQALNSWEQNFKHTHAHACTKVLSSSACFREVSGGKGTKAKSSESVFKETSMSIMPTRCFITPR